MRFFLLNMKFLLDFLFPEDVVDGLLDLFFFLKTGLLVGLGVFKKLVLNFDQLF